MREKGCFFGKNQTFFKKTKKSFGGLKKVTTFALAKQKRGNSSVGRAQPCQGWGREFEPRFPLQASEKSEVFFMHIPAFKKIHIFVLWFIL